jgi:hypothetical protein
VDVKRLVCDAVLEAADDNIETRDRGEDVEPVRYRCGDEITIGLRNDFPAAHG